MGWQDRRYDAETDGPGRSRFRGALRRVFGDGENPLTWAIPLYTAWGIRVQVHVIFVVMIIARLIGSIPLGNAGVAFMAIGMASLFLIVLLHEYGHCFACRYVGGSADQILMWPLGGLAYCYPPPTWRASLITVLGGPAVNVALVPILGVAVGFSIGWPFVLFNPLDPWVATSDIQAPSRPLAAALLVTLYWLYVSNWYLLAFNVLVPMYPMDGGRILQCLLWRRMGERASMRIAANTGFFGAIAMAIVGAVVNNTTLVCIALFGGVTCFIERRRLATMDEGYGYEASAQNYRVFDDEGPGAADDRPSKAELRRRRREEQEQAELDRILAKIARDGMSSLTKAEKKWLSRVTEQRRRQ